MRGGATDRIHERKQRERRWRWPSKPRSFRLSAGPLAIVAEDDIICRINVAEVLSEAGYEVLEAGSADEALAILSGTHEDVILLLTDVEMPGSMNGLELAKAVHSDWPHIEIVVCSGRVKPKEGELPKPVTFLGKPVDTMTLLEKARETVKRGRIPD
jgi:CheY-like chemotaxis protein